jgi:hypothetical protein
VSGALRRHAQAVLLRQLDGRDDILDRLCHHHGGGPLVNRQVPRLPSPIERPVLGDEDFTFEQSQRPASPIPGSDCRTH